MFLSPTRPVFQGESGKLYELLQEIGRGAQGAVYRAVVVGTGEVVAVKVFSRWGVPEDTELRALRQIQQYGEAHPEVYNYVLRFHEMAVSLGGQPRERAMVLELLEGTQLFNVIIEAHQFTELNAIRIIHHIMAGLRHLHRIGILHRDLKVSRSLTR